MAAKKRSPPSEESEMEMRERVAYEARMDDFESIALDDSAGGPIIGESLLEGGLVSDQEDALLDVSDVGPDAVAPLTPEGPSAEPPQPADGSPLTREGLVALIAPIVSRSKTKGSCPTLIHYATGRSVIRVYALVDVPAVYLKEALALYRARAPYGTDEEFLSIVQDAVRTHVPSRLFRYVSYVDMDEEP